MDSELFGFLPQAGCIMGPLLDLGWMWTSGSGTPVHGKASAQQQAPSTQQCQYMRVPVAEQEASREPRPRPRATNGHAEGGRAGTKRADDFADLQEQLQRVRKDNEGLKRVLKEEEAKSFSIWHQLSVERESQQMTKAENRFLKHQIQHAHTRNNRLWEEVHEFMAGRAPSPAVPQRVSRVSQGSQTCVSVSERVAECEAAASRMELQAMQQQVEALQRQVQALELAVQEGAAALEESRAAAAAAGVKSGVALRAAEEAGQQLRVEASGQAAAAQQLHAQLAQSRDETETARNSLAAVRIDHYILRSRHLQTVSENVDFRNELKRMEHMQQGVVELQEESDKMLRATEARAEAAEKQCQWLLFKSTDAASSPGDKQPVLFSSGSTGGSDDSHMDF